MNTKSIQVPIAFKRRLSLPGGHIRLALYPENMEMARLVTQSRRVRTAVHIYCLTQ